MADFVSLDRREFTLRSALALLGGATITVSSCGGGGGSGSSTVPTGSSGTQTQAMGVISNNHGHQAVITSADLVAGGDIRLDIRGQADHPHSVTLTAADLARIRGQQTVAKECSPDGSTMDMHTHMVSFTLGGEQPTPGY